jgi:hypothetical protein
MLANIINNFKTKYPDLKNGLDYILANRTRPNRAAAIIFLKAVYGLSREQVDKMLPKRKKAIMPRLLPTEFLEEAPKEEEKTAAPPPQPNPKKPLARKYANKAPSNVSVFKLLQFRRKQSLKNNFDDMFWDTKTSVSCNLGISRNSKWHKLPKLNFTRD